MTSEGSLKNTQGQPTQDFAARLMAVQACYQVLQNEQPLREVINEYVSHRRDIKTVDGESAGRPNLALFKKILSALESRKSEIEEIFRGHQKSDRTKEAEPLLKAILICGIAEILVHTDIDKALIINDYLNVSHSFYDQKQVSFVNGILDSVAKLLRS